MTLKTQKRGRIFIISAPSGCGKTTLCHELLKADTDLARSISATTRPRRKGESRGRDYYFASKADFQKGISRGRFLEWTKTYGWYYGTPKRFINKMLGRGRDVLLSIDVKGALKVKKIYPDAVLIFILPPSLKELKERLKKRKADGKKEMEKRLRIVKRELGFVNEYDYAVVNDHVTAAVRKLKAILVAERNKVR
jgi:guanylate kinase